MLRRDDGVDKLLKSSTLPTALKGRFDAAGIQRAEQNEFLDRIESLRPTDEQLADIASAENPFAKIAELEAVKSAANRGTLPKDTET